MDLLKQVDSAYLNKRIVRQIEDDDALLEVRVFGQHKSKARSYLDHRLCAISTEVAMRSVADEVKPLIKKYRVLFADKLPPGLPPHRLVDHQINLNPGVKPLNQHSCRMNQVELVALWKLHSTQGLVLISFVFYPLAWVEDRVPSCK